MKAWRIHTPNEIVLDEMESLSVGGECVKIKLLTSGLSSSDSAVYNGTMPAQYPIILGRQAVGFVSEVGEDIKTLTRGDRVVVYPSASCGTCQQCKSGRPFDCNKPAVFGVDEDGFFRDFAVVSSNDLYLIPERLHENDAIFTEHTAMAINAMDKLDIQNGEHIVIVGASIMGIIMAQVAIYYQAVPVLVDTDSDRLELASKLGVYYTIDSVNQDPYKKIFSLTGGRMADAVIFSAVSQMPLQRCIDYVQPGGRMAIVGKKIVNNEMNVNLNNFLSKNLSLMSITNCGKNYSTAINMLANKTVQVSPLISKEISFDQIGKEVIEESKNSGRHIKIIVKH